MEKGTLSDMVSLDGTLTHRARADGSPYLAINQARGTYTRLPEVGDRVGCGDVLYRVDDRAVLLLCGSVPAYRDLRTGDHGRDVRQLNQNLHLLGYERPADRGPVHRRGPSRHSSSSSTTRGSTSPASSPPTRWSSSPSRCGSPR